VGSVTEIEFAKKAREKQKSNSNVLSKITTEEPSFLLLLAKICHTIPTQNPAVEVCQRRSFQNYALEPSLDPENLQFQVTVSAIPR
jgi:hypothetical protein